MTALAPHITAFFQHRLPVERRASHHTTDSYAYAFKLLLTYASKRLHVVPSALSLEQIDAPLVVSFLNDLETTRANRPSSRNVRLAAIKSFMHFLEIFASLRPSTRFAGFWPSRRRRPTPDWFDI
jgi:site-specific recombinase XerC